MPLSLADKTQETHSTIIIQLADAQGLVTTIQILCKSEDGPELIEAVAGYLTQGLTAIKEDIDALYALGGAR